MIKKLLIGICILLIIPSTIAYNMLDICRDYPKYLICDERNYNYFFEKLHIPGIVGMIDELYIFNTTYDEKVIDYLFEVSSDNPYDDYNVYDFCRDYPRYLEFRVSL